jgi:hypothetical protein
MVPGDPTPPPTARGTETEHALTRINVDSSGSETGSSWVSFSRHRTWTQTCKTALEKRTHRLRLSPRSALQKCIRTNGLPSLKLAGVSVDARQQETRKLTRCGFPFWSFSPSGIAVGLQPEAPTRGFEPNCGACFGQRLLSSVIPQKPHAASTRPRHHGKGHMQSVSMCGQKRFSLSLHAVPASDSNSPTQPLAQLQPPQILPLILHPPPSTARSARLHYPRQSRRGNSQPSLARPKRTAQESQPRRPTRADTLAWDLGRDWVGGRRVAQPGRPPDMLAQTNIPPPASTLSHAR